MSSYNLVGLLVCLKLVNLFLEVNFGILIMIVKVA